MAARTAFIALLLSALTGAVAPSANAQTWPIKPLRILISSAPGATSDTVSRGLAEHLAKSLGQPVIVDNRVGADGIIGMEACAKAAPDGYTLCATTSNVMIWNMVLRQRLPYDTLRDFAPVMHGGFFDSALIAINTAAPHIRTGKLKALAVTSNRRVDWLPNVPTFEEEEIKLPLRSWEGYHYPIAVPREQIERMNAELRRAHEAPSFRANIVERVGLVQNTGSPEAFDQHIRAQLKAVAELVNYLSLKPD